MPSKVNKFPWRECKNCGYGYYPKVENPVKCYNCQWKPRIYYPGYPASKKKGE
jgi:predicted Zn-ribbon and HTH transcriptional regulator